ncbi:MAG TPA: 30S ribosomal protein S6 [Vicinamibacteria bacterium]|nr:30S ribosomal protein S6 [Vicinamibacteria bacterium]
MRTYEMMYILDPTLDEDGSTALVGKIEELISRQGVEIDSTEPWGKRRLAYRIKGHWEGNYILSYLKAPPAAISEIERRLRVTDGVLRFLTVRVDEEHVKQERRKSRRTEKEAARRDRRIRRSRDAQAVEASPEGSPKDESMSDESAKEI